MLAKRIIPCLDIKEGRVVKGINFVNLRDAGDPVECALRYCDGGADEIAFLDIAASVENRATLLHLVERTAHAISIPLTVGGGISSVEGIRNLLLAGADKVSLNSAALANPDLVAEAATVFGSQAIVVAIDAKRVPQLERFGEAKHSRYPDDGIAPQDSRDQAIRFQVFSHGGSRPVNRDAVMWCEEVSRLGAGEILLTSMDRDGTGLGYDTELLRRVTAAVTIPVVASGGVGTLEHFAQGFSDGLADAVLAASVFHDGVYSIAEVKRFLMSRGIVVRPALGH